MAHSIDAIAREFAHSAVVAYGTKSVKACVNLLPTKEEDRLIDTVIPVRIGYQRLTAKRFTKQALKESSTKIDRLNERSDSALTVENLAGVDTHRFEVDPIAEVQVIPRITIRFNERREDDRLVRAVIVIKDAALVNGVIRNTHFLNVEIAQTSRRDPEAITRFTAIHDQQALKEMLLPVIGSSDTNYALGYEWELHEGDLELDVFDVECPLIVSGDLTVREPLVEVDVPLIVLGKSRVRSLSLGGDNGAYLMGGVEFEQALLSLHSECGQFVKRPAGPLIFTACEATEITETSGVTCLFEEAIGNTPGDLAATVKAEYLVTEDGYTTIDWDKVVNVLRRGGSILLS